MKEKKQFCTVMKELDQWFQWQNPNQSILCSINQLWSRVLVELPRKAGGEPAWGVFGPASSRGWRYPGSFRWEGSCKVFIIPGKEKGLENVPLPCSLSVYCII